MVCRILLSGSISRKTLENLRENGMIAVSCTRPTDHITRQLKGRVRSIKPVTSSDQGSSRRWHREEQLAREWIDRQDSGEQ